MKVDYDSEGRSLLFEFDGFPEPDDRDDTEDLAGGMCLVTHRDGCPIFIQILSAEKDITPLDEAAERFGLDAEALRAAARAALAAPDRQIHIEVGKKLPLSDEEEPETAIPAGSTPRSG
jgi:hypothetical protein